MAEYAGRQEGLHTLDHCSATLGLGMEFQAGPSSVPSRPQCTPVKYLSTKILLNRRHARHTLSKATYRTRHAQHVVRLTGI
jgi:hypothetical protein